MIRRCLEVVQRRLAWASALVLLVVLPLPHVGDSVADPAASAAGPRTDLGLDGDVIPLTVLVGDRRERFEAEVVSKPSSRARGLMYRTDLAPRRGMLFVFPRSDRQSFWMKNTYISLDIIFIGANRRIVGIVERAEPMTLTARTVDARSQFVLELAAGTARRLGLGLDQQVEFEVTIPAR